MEPLIKQCNCGRTGWIHEDIDSNWASTPSYTTGLPESILTEKEYVCSDCLDKRLGRIKVLTVKVDTKTIHYQFRNKEEAKERAARGIDQIYKQFSVR